MPALALEPHGASAFSRCFPSFSETLSLDEAGLADKVASGEITILADRSVPFNVIEKVMGTCTQHGYERVSLAVMQKQSLALN